MMLNMLKCMLIFVGLLLPVFIHAEWDNVCKNNCEFNYNNVCDDDRGTGACKKGQDCDDCGVRYMFVIESESEPETTTEPVESMGEVLCTPEGVTVMVAVQGFAFGNTMLLGGDSDCAGTVINEGGIVYYRFTTSDYASCGMSIFNTTDDYILYHTFLAEGDVQVMDIYCHMERRSEVSLNVTANPCIVTAVLEGFGAFTFRGSVYENDTFIALHDPDVPVDMCDGTDIYFGIHVDYNGEGIELFVENCYVTEDPDDDASQKYYLITNGCLNVAYNVESSAENNVNKLKKNYNFSATEFVYTYGMTMLYIRCEAVICDSADTSSRCSQGCIPPLHGRMKRGEHNFESTIITQGPYPIQGCPY